MSAQVFNITCPSACAGAVKSSFFFLSFLSWTIFAFTFYAMGVTVVEWLVGHSQNVAGSYLGPRLSVWSFFSPKIWMFETLLCL